MQGLEQSEQPNTLISTLQNLPRVKQSLVPLPMDLLPGSLMLDVQTLVPCSEDVEDKERSGGGQSSPEKGSWGKKSR